ncbi:hypothetical protein CVO77_03110 [Sphingopyxis lindanitolerans]|uniref:Uncharacterized protein n=2 Tax=Sphingopyxis lindanitolerans TaxID=2054227 RepID=A0A2S8B9S0_9SPHN|nr:hypothetical protein CVO77_03110 [Sphingopyxis lindanitolerans]
MLEQAIQADDLPAARSAALRLWQGGNRRLDAQLVLVVDAMRRSDWKGARDYLNGRSDKVDSSAIAKLIVPAFHSWIDVGAREKAPERHLLASAGKGRPEPALALEAALVEAAANRPADAATLAAETVPTDRMSQLVALRLAATLAAAGDAAAADALRGRIALAAGGREDPMLLLPEQPVSTARGGMAHWLALLGDSFARVPGGNVKLSLLFGRAAWWLDDRDWAVRSALAESLDRNGQQGDAAALLTSGRADIPPVLQMRRAELMADAGDLAGATALAEAAAKATPARSMLVRFADIARRADDREAAARAYAALEATLGDGPDDRALRGTLLIARAELRLQADDWDGASALIEQAVALRPDDAAVLNFAGYSAIERRKNVDQALARIEAAWRAEPQNAAITDSLGWAYFLTGRTADAVPLLEKAQASAPGNAVIVEHLGDAYWQAGRRFQARYTWRAAALVADADMGARLAAKLRDGLTAATTAP